MFLAELMENEKNLFWELANLLIAVDGNISKEEIDMLEEYKKELRINNLEIGQEVRKDIDEILVNMNDMDGRGKKIVFFELLGLAYADKDYSDKEKALIKMIKKNFGVNEEEERIMQRSVESIMNIYMDLERVLNA